MLDVETLNQSYASRRVSIIKTKKKYLGFDDSVLFHYSSLKVYLLHILYVCLVSIDKNSEAFPKEAKQYLEPISLFCKSKKEQDLLYLLSNEDRDILINAIMELHSKFIWNVHKVEKRIVYSIPEKYSFIKESHYLLKNVRDKILNVDVYNFFSIPRYSTEYVGIDPSRTRRKKSKYVISSKYLGHVNTPKRDVTGKVIQNIDDSYLPNGVKSFLNYYDLNCSFGIKRDVHDAVECHSRPDNMVVFDISKFFNTFKISNIKSHRLFERIYETFKKSSPVFSFRNMKTQKIDYSSQKEADLFYKIINMFFHNGVLPTGSVFASDLTNLLFFPIDYEIKDVIKNRVAKLLEKYPFLKSTDRNRGNFLTYTRYIDDICISSNFLKISRAIVSALHHSQKYDTKVYEKDFFIGMDIVKDVEKVLNSNGFFIKYEKTKIYSYKMNKKYLGFNFIRRDMVKRDARTYSISGFINTSSYEIASPSSVRYDFNKSFYDFQNLEGEEKNRLTSLFHYYGKPIPLKKIFLFNSVETREGASAETIFNIRAKRKKSGKKKYEFYSLTSSNRKFFK